LTDFHSNLSLNSDRYSNTENINEMRLADVPVNKFESKELWNKGLMFVMEEMNGCAGRGILEIRKEMTRFLLNLNQSQLAKSENSRIHYLHMALIHLENMDREIRISAENEEMIRFEMIHDKIRSLKTVIFEYIRKMHSSGLLHGE